jgi:hypothetical protein
MSEGNVDIDAMRHRFEKIEMHERDAVAFMHQCLIDALACTTAGIETDTKTFKAQAKKRKEVLEFLGQQIYATRKSRVSMFVNAVQDCSPFDVTVAKGVVAITLNRKRVRAELEDSFNVDKLLRLNFIRDAKEFRPPKAQDLRTPLMKYTERCVKLARAATGNEVMTEKQAEAFEKAIRKALVDCRKIK